MSALSSWMWSLDAHEDIWNKNKAKSVCYMGKQRNSKPKRFQVGYQILSSINLKELFWLQMSSYKQDVQENILTSGDTSGSLVLEVFQSHFPIPSHLSLACTSSSYPYPTGSSGQRDGSPPAFMLASQLSALSWNGYGAEICLFPSEDKISPLASDHHPSHRWALLL